MKPVRGNRSDYLRARLKMHHPAIFADLEARKYPSARAAGIAAGIVRVPTPLETILRLLPRLDGRGTGVRGAKGAPSTHVT